LFFFVFAAEKKILLFRDRVENGRPIASQRRNVVKIDDVVVILGWVIFTATFYL
jgi:hypothetical protein